MAISEIEKLERRYADNPQGLTFAPLAEARRKSGDVARALELLHPGLELHPDYIPASIVLGRCHLDQGDLSAAETAFKRVLVLDNENVIALKALADVCERQLRLDQAEDWLRALIAIDRSNDDARDQLSRVEGARRRAEETRSAEAPPAPAAASPPASEAAARPVEEPAAGSAAVPVERTAEAPTAWGAEPAETPPEPREARPEADGVAAADAVDADLAGAGVAADAAEPAVGQPDFELSEAFEAPRDEAVASQLDSFDGLVLSSGASGPGEIDLQGVEEVERADELVLRGNAQSEFQVPDASLELALDAPHSPSVPVPAAPAISGEDRAPDHAPVSEEQAGPPVAEAPGADEPIAEPAPVVTETMAELLRAQGHEAEALEIYRELDRRSGGDPRFRDKVEELAGAAASAAPPPVAEPAAEPVAEPAAAEPTPVAPVRGRSLVAQDTGGESVGQFFRALLAARLPEATRRATPAAPSPTLAAPQPTIAAPPAGAAPALPSASPTPAPAETTGAPTRPASDALSLSAVFGDEAPAVPPAVPAGAGGVSFDDFFGGTAPASRPKPPRTPDPKDDDLDQFHAWLQNLKR